MTLILIAEDDDDIRTVLQRLFDHAGFKVLTAPDGRAALDAAREHHPDVVLTDLDIPHLNGLQLCQAIRHDPALADTPVAILSGGLQPGDPRTADAYICGVLLKPFSKGQLITDVRRLAEAGHHPHQAPCLVMLGAGEPAGSSG
jgi:CheY-like chemotaxis protein